MSDRTRRPWTQEEDSLLAEIVNSSNQIVWTKIAEKFEFRTGKQCRERWINHLNPKKVEAEWTPREDKLLFHLHNILGNRWSQIASNLQRSEYSVKNRWNRISSGKIISGKFKLNNVFPSQVQCNANSEGEHYYSVPVVPKNSIGAGSFNLNVTSSPISLMNSQLSVPISTRIPPNKIQDQSMMDPDFGNVSKITKLPVIDMSISSLLNH